MMVRPFLPLLVAAIVAGCIAPGGHGALTTPSAAITTAHVKRVAEALPAPSGWTVVGTRTYDANDNSFDALPKAPDSAAVYRVYAPGATNASNLAHEETNILSANGWNITGKQSWNSSLNPNATYSDGAGSENLEHVFANKGGDSLLVQIGSCWGEQGGNPVSCPPPQKPPLAIMMILTVSSS